MSAPQAPRVDAAPFEFRGVGRVAVLCLHGLTGTPYEVRPLGEACAAMGFDVLGPTLPGHGGAPEALAAVSHRDWLAAARGHAQALRQRSPRVFAVGLSMGGLLSLELAAMQAVDALVVIGTPLRLRAPIPWLVPLAKWVRPFARKLGGSDIREPAARARHPSMDVMPLASVHELVRLQRVVRRHLARVRAPLLVAHGALDRTASPTDARAILAAVGSAEREALELPNSGHVVPVDHDGPALAKATVEFLSRHA